MFQFNAQQCFPQTQRVQEEQQMQRAQKQQQREERQQSQRRGAGSNPREGVELLRSSYINEWVDGVVNNLVTFGAFIRIPLAHNTQGLLHISDMARGRVESPWSVLSEGQEVRARVQSVGDDGRVQLSLVEQRQNQPTTGVIQEDEVQLGSPVTSPFEFALKQAGVNTEQFKNAAARDAANGEEAPNEDVDGESASIASSQTPDIATASMDATSESANGSTATSSSSNGRSGTLGGGKVSPALVKQLRDSSGAGMMDCKEALTETGGDVEEAMAYLRRKGLSKAEKKQDKVAAEGAIGTYVHTGNSIGVLVEVNCETDFVGRSDKFKQLVHDIAMQVASSDQVAYVNEEDIPESVIQAEKENEMQCEDLLDKPENVREQIVDGRVEKTKKSMALMTQPYIKDTDKTVEEVVKGASFELGEKVCVRRFERYTLGEDDDGSDEEESDNFATEVSKQVEKAQQQAASAPEPQQQSEHQQEEESSVKVSPQLVKQLREQTGAGMMECKKALTEAGGEDMGSARDILKRKGVAKAEKKRGRRAADGAIGSYVHTGNSIGVLVKVNSETDFVGRSDEFQTLVHDIAMQIAASEGIKRVDTSHVSQQEREELEQEEWQREDLEGKPDDVKQKVVNGRVDKRLQDGTLMESEFIKDPSKTVGEHVKEKVAALGENIVVRRFMRYDLGAGIEKPAAPSFAEEVAEQAAGNF
jgi:elongation factor Ts